MAMHDIQTHKHPKSSALDSLLPVNLEDLIHARSVENVRREFKATWNAQIKPAVVKTVCAFANDLHGGYVILGIETDEQGHPILPPRGLDIDRDKLQRELRGACRQIDPVYQPLICPVEFQNRPLLVIWAPGGDNRPYAAPESSQKKARRLYFVRQGSETVRVNDSTLRSQLFEQASKIPFDDRRSSGVGAETISASLVREFLENVGSDLSRTNGYAQIDIYRNMQLVTPVNDHAVPKHVALLFFTENPDVFFPGARIEIVQFSDDAGGVIEERIIRGPLPSQIRQALIYLESLSDVLLEKVPGRTEVDRTVVYPVSALREAVVNAVYHRSYENAEPIKIYLYPNRMEIISYPGPLHGIDLEHLNGNDVVPPIPARNRRIGALLKELKLAEARSTGLPKMRRDMRENGSPAPRFDFDPDRTYFRATLPAHPRYRVIHALRESALMWATGDRRAALQHLLHTAQEQSGSGALVGQIIAYAASMDEMDLAEAAFERFDAERNRSEASQPYLRLAEAYLNRRQDAKARRILEKISASPHSSRDRVEAAILNKRMRNHQEAHRLFAEIYPYMKDDPKVVHEYAQTKIALARKNAGDLRTKRRLNREATELLRRAISLAENPTRKAWCWFDLAQTLAWLREPRADVERAYREAMALKPDEPRFKRQYQNWKRPG